jgi:hypothetical protein
LIDRLLLGEPVESAEAVGGGPAHEQDDERSDDGIAEALSGKNRGISEDVLI